MNVDLLIKENQELNEEKQRYKEMWFNANNSLAKYRKLEEQLGCPLEVVFKAISNGIYVKDLPREDLNKYFGLRLSNIETEWYLSNNVLCVNIKGYKTVFWLKEDKNE